MGREEIAYGIGDFWDVGCDDAEEFGNAIDIVGIVGFWRGWMVGMVGIICSIAIIARSI